MKQTKSNLTIIIPVISLLVSAMVLLFGNNIMDRFSGAKLTMNSTKFEDESNSKVIEYMKNNNGSSLLSEIPNYIRVINIKNIGSMPSNNLNIDISLDGNLCNYKVDSTETIENQTINGQKLSIKLHRLSKNADLKIILWLKDEKNGFQVNYADDKNSKTIDNDDQTTYKLSSINILMLAIIFISLGFIVKGMLSKAQVSLEKTLNGRAIQKLTEVFDEIKEEKEKEEKEEKEDDSEQLKEKLKEIINVSKKV